MKGQRILPGVAHLELARAAVEQAAEVQGVPCTIKLKNAVWVRPIVVEDQPMQVHIRLSPEESGEISYEIYGHSDVAGEQSIVFSQGSAVLNPAGNLPAVDLPSLLEQCKESHFSVNEVYDTYRMIGFEYGPAYRGVKKSIQLNNLFWQNCHCIRQLQIRSANTTCTRG
ncbi:polyketide synthase dehydratase domain-containing protein [Bacillus stercoris]|nr:polyketide synthase dehydratase domain-containing protein [Bacillus stercoris]